MKLADKITYLRKENNMTQEELAHKVGVSRQSVSKWEAGGALPDLDKLLKISKLFGVSTDYLIDEEIDTFEKTNEKKTDIFTDDFVYQFIRRAEDRSVFMSVGTFLMILSAIGSISGSKIGWALGIIAFIAGLGMFIYSIINRDRVYSIDDGAYFNFANNITNFKPAFKRNVIIAVCFYLLAYIFYNRSFDLDWVQSTTICLLPVAIGTSIIIYSIIRRNAYNNILSYIDDASSIARGWTSTASSNYWMAVTAFYLVYSYFSGNWYISWIIWIIAPIGENILRSIFK